MRPAIDEAVLQETLEQSRVTAVERLTAAADPVDVDGIATGIASDLR